MGIRKNQSSLSAPEKTAFVDAVKALKANGIYDAFVAQHRAAFMASPMIRRIKDQPFFPGTGNISAGSSLRSSRSTPVSPSLTGTGLSTGRQELRFGARISWGAMEPEPAAGLLPALLHLQPENGRLQYGIRETQRLSSLDHSAQWDRCPLNRVSAPP
jgi:hypothetical protein